MRTRGSAERLSWGLVLAGAVAGVVPVGLAGLRTLPELLRGGLVNPDSAMRLVRLHDILAAGRPLHAVMRDGSGEGTMLHWSHLLDSLLLVLAAPFAGLVGWDRALHGVGLVFGPLCLAALGVAVVWVALPVAGRTWAWVGALAVGGAPVLDAYGMPGVVHHHVLLAVGATMAAGWALRLLRGGDPRAGGIALGAWAGALLWLSPESLPFTLMALGALWAAWLGAPARRPTALVVASTTFLLVAFAAWVVDPPAAGYAAVEPDRISLPFVLLALGAALVAGLACSGRRGASVAFGVGLGGVWLLAFPQMHRGTAGLMPPEAAAAFFDGILEMMPVNGAEGVFEDLLGGLFAVAVLGVLAWRGPSLLRLYVLGCAVVLVGLAAAHVRFAAYPAAGGAALLPMVLAWISQGGWAPGRQSMARLAVLLPLLLLPMLAPLTASATPGVGHADCSIEGAIPLLAGHSGEVVLAEVNETPELLYRTPVRTVGSLYHRNPAGFMRLRAAWRAVPGAAPSAEFLATGATLVLACPGGARSSILEGLPRTTLLDRLLAGEPPAWLHRLADAGPDGFVLYGVAP